jgi:DNA polymerase (family X)
MKTVAMSERHRVVSALEEIANYIDLSEKNRFKAIAYRRAARTLETWEGDLTDAVARGELLSIPGVGKGIAPIIDELVRTGTASYLEQLRSEFPAGIFELMRIESLGLKKVGILYAELGIATIEDLEKACAEQNIRKLPGFGKKTEEKICASLAELKDKPVRHLLPKGLGTAQRLIELVGRIRNVSYVEVTGSIRRRLETVGGVDLLVVTSRPKAVVDALLGHELLQEAHRKDAFIVGAIFRSEMRVNFYVAKPEHAGAALLITTGSTLFVESLQAIAKKKEIDLTIDSQFAEEDDVFAALDMMPVVPELREDAAPKRKKRPRLIDLNDIRGTFHIHTTWSDGRASVYEMLEACVNSGHEYAGISDHSKTASYAGGLTEDRLVLQQAEIEEKKSSFSSLRVFKGTEVDILQDGTLDYAPKTMALFDFSVASVHSRFKMERDEMTARIVKALHDPFVTFLGHMTGRLLLSRPPYQLDVDAVIDAAAKNGVIIEINANPHRLDVDWRYMKQALDRGVIFSINPDAHSVDEMLHMQAGTWHARKGGIEPKHVFNTLGVDAVAEYLATRRERAMRMTKVKN